MAATTTTTFSARRWQRIINDILNAFPSFPDGINPLDRMQTGLIEAWMVDVSTYLRQCTEQKDWMPAVYLTWLIRKCVQLHSTFHLLHPTINKQLPLGLIGEVIEAARVALRHPYDVEGSDGNNVIYFFHEDVDIIRQYVRLGWDD